MSHPRPYHIALTLARFRLGVAACCWLIGACLLVQLLVWTGAVFTQSRFEPENQTAEAAGPIDPAPPEVVIGRPQRTEPRMGTLAGRALSAPTAASSPGAPEAASVAPNDGSAAVLAVAATKPSFVDVLMRKGAAATAVVGPIAFLLLVPLMAMGVMVAVVGHVPGTERAASALLWGGLLATIALPVGRALGVSTYGGLFLGYDAIVGPLDATMGEDGFPHPGVVDYARHLVLPLASIVAMALVGLLFRAGIDAGLLPREILTVDPVTEREAGRITAAGPRLGGRASAALGNAMPAPAPPPAAPERAAPAPGVLRSSAGDAPRRII